MTMHDVADIDIARRGVPNPLRGKRAVANPVGFAGIDGFSETPLNPPPIIADVPSVKWWTP
jgi:hypothetical protein